MIIVNNNYDKQRFKLLDNGTIIDFVYHRMWRQALVGQAWDNGSQGSAILLAWDECQSQSWGEYAGYTDWRLPGLNEMQLFSILQTSGLPNYWVWTSTESGNNKLAWVAPLWLSRFMLRPKTDKRSVLLVRGYDS